MAVSLPDRVAPGALLGLLADGELRSETSLVQALGLTQGQLIEGVERLRALGIEIDAPGDGYRLARGVELLDAARLRAMLRPDSRGKLHSLDVLFEVDSTNTRLLGMPPPPRNFAHVAMSELQHAGRGRRGRQWLSPFGGSLAMSLGWVFRDAVSAPPSLSLAVGVAVARALEREGARDIRLKWPNDIWFEDRKVGGVLVEVKIEPGGAAHAVIGVGLNLALPASARREIEAGGVRVAAVADACAQEVSRNRLAAALIDELLSMLGDFERRGFAAFRDEWQALDALGGRAVQVLSTADPVTGTSCGVDSEGALLLDSGGRLQKIVSGDLSLRAVGDPVAPGAA
jgi:BirA family biotin operon repressor/biotin-[acetyl-CoA-carboxylase] ligase